MKEFTVYPYKDQPFVYNDEEKGILFISGLMKTGVYNARSSMLRWIMYYIDSVEHRVSIYINHNSIDEKIIQQYKWLLHKINMYEDRSERCSVKWFYNVGDNNIFNAGEIIKTFCNFPFTFHSVEKRDSICFPKSNETPLIYFDILGDFIISGDIITKDPLEFFIPVFLWLQNMSVNYFPKSVRLDIHINTITEKAKPFIKAICHFVDILQGRGSQSIVIWKYSNLEIEKMGMQTLNDLSVHRVFKEV